MTEYINVKGKKLKITRSQRKGKKYKTVIDGKEVHFGAAGYRIKPGTKQGDSYCARSAKIKTSKPASQITPNDLSRAMWRCKGNKSMKRKS